MSALLQSMGKVAVMTFRAVPSPAWQTFRGSAACPAKRGHSTVREHTRAWGAVGEQGCTRLWDGCFRVQETFLYLRHSVCGHSNLPLLLQ